MSERKLLPCPFCGGEAKVMKHTEVIGHGSCVNEYYVQCLECGAQGPMESERYKRKLQCIEDCTRKWNERVQIDD